MCYGKEEVVWRWSRGLWLLPEKLERCSGVWCSMEIIQCTETSSLNTSQGSSLHSHIPGPDLHVSCNTQWTANPIAIADNTSRVHRAILRGTMVSLSGNINVQVITCSTRIYSTVNIFFYIPFTMFEGTLLTIAGCNNDLVELKRYLIWTPGL